jgi:hypothetical protein
MSATAIERALGEARRRLRRARAAEAALGAAARLVAGGIALLALDNLAHLPAAARAAGSLAFLAAAAALGLARVLPAFSRRPSDDEVALLLERAAPGFENRLINAVQLGRRPLDAFGEAALGRIAAEAADSLGALEPGAVVPRRRLARAGGLALAAAVALAAYAGLFPEHFRNALARYVLPGARIAPITRTRLAIEPGDATVLEGSGLEIRAVASGAIPARAVLVMRDAAGAARYEMRFAGDAFVFSLEDLRRPLAYSVEAGDAASAEYRVEVLDRPRLAQMTVEYRFPAYLERPPERVDPADGNLAAVEGTRAIVRGRANRPLRAAEARLESGLPAFATARGDRVTVEIDLAARDRYRVFLTDERGLCDRDPPAFAIEALPDGPPEVEIRGPAPDLALRAGAEVALAVAARDDWALAEASLAASAPGKPERRLETWSGEGRREAVFAAVVRLRDLGAAPGETITLLARARDKKGQEATSAPLAVRILSDKEAAAREAALLAKILGRLRAILEKERAARAAAAKGASVEAAQEEILALTRGVLADWTDPEIQRARAFALVRGLASKEMPAALRETGEALLALQDAIIRTLEEALAEMKSLADAARAGGLEKALAAAEALRPEALAKDLLRGLKAFDEEERRVLALTQDLRDVAPEDLTDAQKKEFAELRATEARWAKYVEEKARDLSKVPPQDFSNASLAKDLAAMRSDLVKAGDALGRKAAEIAVPLEESGLELAKEITTNIERWLAGAPDATKWNMEEPKGPADVPMADLPAELEDIMGDLLDKEDALAEAAQDVTSSWLDSMDKGVGWTVADGPIGNMSAKGITGNLQPNANEMSGRSGEGRSGKSNGQFVGDSAVGKGGTPTPTRLTPDPYEAGRVKDTSKDGGSAASGGGKEAGGNREGLRGEPPPETQRKMDRLASDQADVRSAAEKVKVALERRAVRAEDLARAIAAMRALEDELRARRAAGYAGEVREIVERLTAAKKAARGVLEASRDPSRALPQALRAEIRNALDEPMPREYEDAVRAYFRVLSEGR